jgi:phospholipase C
VVVIGENHGFDNLFGVYRPRAGRDAQLVGGCSRTQQPRHQLNATRSTS